MGKPDERMFSIKLIWPNYQKVPFFRHDLDGTDGKWPMMNFSKEGNGPSIAANVPTGGRSLVYVTKRRKFIWAIEYTGTTEAGQQAALAHGIQPALTPSKWGIFRPIRFLAWVDLEAAPTADKIEELTGFHFKPCGGTLHYIKASDYHKVYNAIRWQWAATDSPEPLHHGEEPGQAVR